MVILNKKYIHFTFGELLIIGLIISPIFSHLFYFEGLMYKFQFTEILFIVGLIYFVINFKKIRFPGLNLIDYSFLFLAFILILNVACHYQKNVALQVTSTLYLISLYFLISKVLIPNNSKKLNLMLRYGSAIGFWLMIAVGVIGFWVHYLFGVKNFVLIYDDYPYFGNVFRVKGFSYSPNIYISLLCFFTCIKHYSEKLKWWHILLVFVLAIATLTKEALILIAILLVFSVQIINLNKKLLFIPVLLAGLLYLVFSWFVISFNNKEFAIHGNVKRVTSVSPVYSNSDFEIYSTTYFSLFKTGIIMFKDNPVTGVGLGNFSKELINYSNSGIYPEHYEKYDPHDSYFGIASQLGILYLIFIVFFIYSLIKTTNYSSAISYFPLSILLIYFMFESLSIGSFHFRHYYVFFGMFFALNTFQSKDKQLS